MATAPRTYDVIVFGDEVPGVLAAIAAAREYRRRTQQYPRILILSKGNLQEGIGGHLVRGGLAYLDRTQIDSSLRDALGLDTFGDPASIYKEFLQKAEVKNTALDPRKADIALRKMLNEAGVSLLSRVQIQSVSKLDKKIASITTVKGETFSARVFIDSTVNAELAQAAGVKKLQGFETFGLPQSELPVSLIFETQGLSIRKLKEIEYHLIKRFINLSDTEFKKYLLTAAGNDPKFAENLRKDMVDSQGNFKTLWQHPDSIDVRSPALSVAYHSFRLKKFSLYETGAILDKANIAILPDERLSWNALLFAVNSSEAEALARGSAKPTAKMREEMMLIEKWFKSFGATAVTPASELYIRHAGNVRGVVQPFPGSQMLMGGASAATALGTFSYHFDVRGGIPGIGQRANTKGWKQGLSFEKPIFNIGIQHALIKDIPNLAVVSPASGFVGLAPAAGRIVEFNSGVGQGLGIAAVIALLSGRNFANIGNWEVRQVLIDTKQFPRVFGVPKFGEATKLASFESLLATV